MRCFVLDECIGGASIDRKVCPALDHVFFEHMYSCPAFHCVPGILVVLYEMLRTVVQLHSLLMYKYTNINNSLHAQQRDCAGTTV